MPRRVRRPHNPGSSTDIPAARRKMQEAQFFYSRLGRKPPTDTTFTAGQVHRFYLSAFLSAPKSVFNVAGVELNGAAHFNAWRGGLSLDDRVFLRDVLGQRDLETHRGGIRVEEQDYQYEPIHKTAWLAELVPERLFVIGGRRYGASVVAARTLGLLAGFLDYVQTGNRTGPH